MTISPSGPKISATTMGDSFDPDGACWCEVGGRAEGLATPASLGQPGPSCTGRATGLAVIRRRAGRGCRRMVGRAEPAAYPARPAPPGDRTVIALRRDSLLRWQASRPSPPGSAWRRWPCMAAATVTRTTISGCSRCGSSLTVGGHRQRCGRADPAVPRSTGRDGRAASGQLRRRRGRAVRHARSGRLQPDPHPRLPDHRLLHAPAGPRHRANAPKNRNSLALGRQASRRAASPSGCHRSSGSAGGFAQPLAQVPKIWASSKGGTSSSWRVGARLGRAVGAPAQEAGRVAEPAVLHLLVGDLGHQLGAQRRPAQVLLGVPPAAAAGQARRSAASWAWASAHARHGWSSSESTR